MPESRSSSTLIENSTPLGGRPIHGLSVQKPLHIAMRAHTWPIGSRIQEPSEPANYLFLPLETENLGNAQQMEPSNNHKAMENNIR